MVLTKNLYSRKKGKSSQAILQSNKKLPYKLLRTKNGSLIRLTLKNAKLTSCGITLQETAINNSILRTHLERYNFSGLMNINKNNKRKRSVNTLDHGQRSHKKLRLNGSTINESFRKLPNLSNKKSSDVNTKSKKYKENIDRDNLRKSVKREEKQSPKIFEKSKFKIRLTQNSKIKAEKTIKQAPILEKVRNSEEKVKKALKQDVHLNGTGIYYLKFKREKGFSEGRFNYKFQQLVTDVKNMNLPSVAWKIKVIIRQNKISAITFTNKQELERSVTFSLETDHYKLMIDNKRAHLLGSPTTIDTPGDIEILLDILEHIESSSSIILYR